MVALIDPGRESSNCLAYLVSSFSLLQRWPLLFTTILAVSAKFFRKELYDALANHSHTLLLRAVFSGQSSLDIVKALILMVFWRDPSDRSASIKIGIALRLCQQLNLHIPRTQRLPADRERADYIRDSERTWFCES